MTSSLRSSSITVNGWEIPGLLRIMAGTSEWTGATVTSNLTSYGTVPVGSGFLHLVIMGSSTGVTLPSYGQWALCSGSRDGSNSGIGADTPYAGGSTQKYSGNQGFLFHIRVS